MIVTSMNCYGIAFACRYKECNINEEYIVVVNAVIYESNYTCTAMELSG
jgi:hypothetical protein